MAFLAETLAGLCIVPLSFLRQPVSAKGENYSRLDRNVEQQLLLERVGMDGVVVLEPWCARCVQPFVTDIEIIVDGSSVFPSYRRATATQRGSRGKRGRAVSVKYVFVRVVPLQRPQKACSRTCSRAGRWRQWQVDLITCERRPDGWTSG